MAKGIGKEIKELRTNRKYTLKDLSEKTGLSTGFLSQLERGMTTIAMDSLEKVAKALHVDLSYFFSFPKNHNENHILHSYEQTILKIESAKFIYYSLSNSVENKDMFPKLVEILPSDCSNINEFSHNGEEFIYVLEGILTLFINHQRYDLYPEDSAHFDSSIPHNWSNCTNKIVKVLAINTPNTLKNKEKDI